MNYFAYGSNMSLKRIQKRCPSAAVVCVACMRKYSLRFHKPGIDGSAKADAFWTGSNDDVVYGVVYNIAHKDIAALDAAEGAGVHYERKRCKVISTSSRRVKAQIYTAMFVCDKDERPYDWYLAHITTGAQENMLPEDYQHALNAVVSKKQVKKVTPVVYSHYADVASDTTPSTQDSDDTLFNHMSFEDETESYNNEPSYDYDYEERLDELAMYGLDED
ncbi:MAG: hypothetical protein DRN30_06230, partial [Thermoplasmata archaeon]